MMENSEQNNKHGPNLSLLDLPQNVLHRILKRLDRPSIANVGKTCRFLRVTTQRYKLICSDYYEEQLRQEREKRGKSGRMDVYPYLIAIVQKGHVIKVYGSRADIHDCYEFVEMNGKSLLGDSSQYAEIVNYIAECIKLADIRVRIKRAITPLINDKDSSLLDVWVIGCNGADADEQLDRFLTDTMDTKMELLELKNSNQTTVNNTFNINQHNQRIISNQQSQAQQLQTNQQINMGPTQIYGNYQQQEQQQQQGLRYISNPKVLKHRELPVDVPDSFVGVAKQSPRYPPPKPQRQVSPPMPMNNMTTFNHAPPSMAFSSNTPNNSAQQSNIPPSSQSTAANIATHNSSLRSSIKLKQLEKSKNGQHGNYPVGQLQPAVNQAFELNEDEAVSTSANQSLNNNQTSSAKQALKVKQSMPDLCSIYNRLQRNLNGEFAEVTGDAKLTKLLSIYNTIVQTHNKQFRIPDLISRHATTINSQGNPEYKVLDLLQEVIFSLQGEEMTIDAAELLAILCKHEVEGVCSAFDRISQSFEFAKSSRPPSPQNIDMVSANGPARPPVYSQRQTTQQMDDYDYAPDQVQMDIENNLYQNGLQRLTEIDLSDGPRTRIIRISKNQSLGATIKNEADAVVIGRVVYGGAAHKQDLLHEGDEILDVNGVQMRGKSVDEVVRILEEMNGTLEFTLVTRYDHKLIHRNSQEKIYVRTFFEHDGSKDKYIPCKELGLSFRKGEILAIIDQSDPQWWQAHREGDSESHFVGLIPSIEFLKQREKSTNHEDITANYFRQAKKTGLIGKCLNWHKGPSPRRKKKPAHIPFGPEEIPYYEEVCVYYPDKYRRRPIILVGPKMIGQREILKKLLQDTSRFSSAVSHTSKPMESHERDGVDFHFVSRAQFEADIKANKFIECGQYQNQYYGTSLEAMKEVVKSKKTCIHLVNTPSIFNFRNGRAGAELKPFFVFVKPDDSHPDKLRNIVSSFSQPKSNIEENIEIIMAEVHTIETHYLPYFDLVITVKEVEQAYRDLLSAIDKIEQDQQWIPMFWQDSPSS